MSTEVKAPALGESVSEIYVGKWFKAPGDQVTKDEPLVELESDKATVDLPAMEQGILAKILKPSGSTVEVGEVIALIDEGTTANAEKEGTRIEEERPHSSTAPQPETTEQPVAEMESEDVQDDTTHAMTYSDIAGPVAEEETEEATTLRSPEEINEPEKPPPEAQDAHVHTAEPQRMVERVPMSPLRRRIALRLVEAQQQAALLTTFNEVDMSAIKQLRADLGAAFEKKHGVRLGLMSFFVKAAMAALEEIPELNAVIENNAIVYRRFYDIGIAVSTEKGLVVPVLRNTEQMSFAEIERAIVDFAERARNGELKVEDLQGGTFTITNGGIFGSLLSTPIINPPQSGVLGMHAIQDRPVVRNAEVVIRPMMYLALTYDHRIVDGRGAVMFLSQIKKGIETPSRLFLDV
jgi:2-oxoglutarate dehydrogenase E2 component (dihydrolipoamide succinyltransferase)